MLAPGDMIGDGWRISRAIGSGGIGAVYLADHQETGQEAAVKIIVPPSPKLADRLRNRLQREAAVLARLDHPGIVQVFGSGEDTNRRLLYLVMEHIEGAEVNRRHVLDAAHRLDELKLRALLEQIVDALTFAHDAKVAHRDLKPQNILVRRRNGRPVLVDWGSVYEEDADHRLTKVRDSHALGRTDIYAPPEALFNPLGADPYQWDIYSVGAMMYALAVGEDGIYDDDDLTRQQLAVVKTQGALDPGDKVSPGLREVIVQTTQPMPDARPRSMRKVRVLLDQWQVAPMNSGKVTFFVDSGFEDVEPVLPGERVPTQPTILRNSGSSEPTLSLDSNPLADDEPSTLVQDTELPSEVSTFSDTVGTVSDTRPTQATSARSPLLTALLGLAATILFVSIAAAAGVMFAPAPAPAPEQTAAIAAPPAAVANPPAAVAEPPAEPVPAPTPEPTPAAPPAREAASSTPAVSDRVEAPSPPAVTERTPAPPEPAAVEPPAPKPADARPEPPTAPVPTLEAALARPEGMAVRWLAETPARAMAAVEEIARVHDTPEAQETAARARRTIVREMNAKIGDGNAMIDALAASGSLVTFLASSKFGQGADIKLPLRIRIADKTPARVKAPTTASDCRELAEVVDIVGRAGIPDEQPWIRTACEACTSLTGGVVGKCGEIDED